MQKKPAPKSARKKKALLAFGMTVVIFCFYGLNLWKFLSRELQGPDASTVYLVAHVGEAAVAFLLHFVVFYLVLVLMEKGMRTDGKKEGT